MRGSGWQKISTSMWQLLYLSETANTFGASRFMIWVSMPWFSWCRGLTHHTYTDTLNGSTTSEDKQLNFAAKEMLCHNVTIHSLPDNLMDAFCTIMNRIRFTPKSEWKEQLVNINKANYNGNVKKLLCSIPILELFICFRTVEIIVSQSKDCGWPCPHCHCELNYTLFLKVDNVYQPSSFMSPSSEDPFTTYNFSLPSQRIVLLTSSMMLLIIRRMKRPQPCWKKSNSFTPMLLTGQSDSTSWILILSMTPLLLPTLSILLFFQRHQIAKWYPNAQ